MFFWSSSVVLFLPNTASSYSVKIGWDSNSEPDLEGYKLYNRERSPCPPYNHVDTYSEMDLINPLYPVVKIIDLDKNITYYFVITAYDTSGNESDFSNVVSILNGVGGEAICSSSIKNSSGDDGDGGGGGR